MDLIDQKRTLSPPTTDRRGFPKSIALIPDGNRRWAYRRGLSPKQGHEAGANNVLPIVRAANDFGIEEMTIYAFSTENWRRNVLEVRTLMYLISSFLRKICPEMIEEGISFHAIGNLSSFPSFVTDTIEETCERTKEGDKMKVILGLNYGGRDEIRRAVQHVAADCVAGKLSPEQISERLLNEYMDTASFSDPELIIRTSGELRLSNFLLWQSYYAEFYATPVYWPDFSREDLRQALEAFSHRQRRLGGV